jgi:hypothetical protein
MKLISSFKIVDSLSLSVGELVKFWDFGSPNFGIVYGRYDNRHLKVVLLTSEDTKAFTHGQITPGWSFSYGLDWVIEILETEETKPGNSQPMEIPGVITVSTEKRMRLGYAPSHNNARYIDLESFKLDVSEKFDGVPITKWQIWATEGECNAKESLPLVRYDARANPATTIMAPNPT